MHPLSTILLFLGYVLALPIALKMPIVVAKQHRLAMTGHQAGVTIALLGWLVRGTYSVAVIHVVWLIGVRIWFSANPSRRRS